MQQKSTSRQRATELGSHLYCNLYWLLLLLLQWLTLSSEVKRFDRSTLVI